MMTILALALTLSLSPQSLADTAKKAEEQRRTTTGAIRIEAIPAGLTISPVRLDKPTIEHYTKARMAMAEMWQRDERLYSRVRSQLGTSRTGEEIVAALEAQPDVMALLTLYGYTGATFLAMELSIVQAERLAEGGFELEALSPVERANYEFIGRSSAWTSAMRGRVYRAEAGRHLWN